MKKMLALLLSLALALSLAAPALAVENDLLPAPEDGWEEYEPTEYDKGWEAAYQKGYDKGYALGTADGKKTAPKPPEESEYTQGDTYEDGYADGLISGRNAGYANGYYDATGRVYWTDREILDKGGVPGQVNVMFDGQCVAFPDAVPKIVSARTMIPVRAVMETMDAQVDYDKAGRVVLITKDDVTVSFVIGSSAMTIIKDGDEVTTEEMDCAPYIENSRTMVPLRFLSQAFGYTVLWDQEHRTAVVVDDDALIGEIDGKFTHLNRLLASQLQSQAGKKYQQTDTVTGKVTFYDAAGKAVACPFSASSTAYTDGRSCKIDLTLNLKDALLTLNKAYPDLLEGINVDLGTALTTDLSNITATLLLTPEGRMYLQMPLLSKTLLGLANEETWLDLGSIDIDLSRAETLTIGRAIVPALLVDEGSFQLQDTLDLSVAMLEAIFGDQAAKVSGSSVTWTLDGKALADAMGAELDDAADLLDNFSLVTTMGKNGACSITGSWKADLEGSALAMALKYNGSMTGGSCAFTCSIQDLFALELSSTTTIKTVSTLPSMTLPQGAVVENLAD